jgi:hypothetical protein
MKDDATMRRAFAELREGDAIRTPSLQSILAQRHSSIAPLRWQWATAVSLAIAVAVFGVYQAVHRLRPTPAVTEAPMLLAWQSPTDFLLDTPGLAVLRATPYFGRVTSSLSLPSSSISLTTTAPGAIGERP